MEDCQPKELAIMAARHKAKAIAALKRAGYAGGGSVYAADTGTGLSGDPLSEMDMPETVRQAAIARGSYLTPEQSRRYEAARNAKISAQENMNQAHGSGGQRYTAPEQATGYPAFRRGGKPVPKPAARKKP
jgi:hypothetical protein